MKGGAFAATRDCGILPVLLFVAAEAKIESILLCESDLLAVCMR